MVVVQLLLFRGVHLQLCACETFAAVVLGAEIRPETVSVVVLGVEIHPPSSLDVEAGIEGPAEGTTRCPQGLVESSTKVGASGMGVSAVPGEGVGSSSTWSIVMSRGPWPVKVSGAGSPGGGLICLRPLDSELDQ